MNLVIRRQMTIFSVFFYLIVGDLKFNIFCFNSKNFLQLEQLAKFIVDKVRTQKIGHIEIIQVTRKILLSIEKIKLDNKHLFYHKLIKFDGLHNFNALKSLGR